ncbi:nucleotidyltransferase domain-containing protein [Candidatus Woesearchaeota archaeon]|nr:nucleotidyltransferase domain-containing protein [Candidatus Woesearchaeota archaeon]
MKSNNLIAYAVDFTSFFIQNIEEVERHEIKNIILFGSIARADFDKNSDVDIFIETANKNIEIKAEKILNDFYKSLKYTKYWRLFGVNNEISLKVGELDKWELKSSIISNGVILYGKYRSDVTETKTKQYTLFELKIKGKRKNMIRIWRKLYGYKQKVGKKWYNTDGLIKHFNGEKIGKAIFIIPIENTQPVLKYLKDNKVTCLIHNIWKGEI